MSLSDFGSFWKVLEIVCPILEILEIVKQMNRRVGSSPPPHNDPLQPKNFNFLCILSG